MYVLQILQVYTLAHRPMPLLGLRNKGIPKATDLSPPVAKEQVGLLVTAELEQALAECKKKVERISKTCRATNRKFR